jgi:hypothetical protein
MSIEVTQEVGPSHWASYLINGDDSGLEEHEVKACDAWQQSLAPFYVVSTADEEPWFTWHYRVHGGDAEGGEVITYILHRQRRKYTRKVKAFNVMVNGRKRWFATRDEADAFASEYHRKHGVFLGIEKG